MNKKTTELQRALIKWKEHHKRKGSRITEEVAKLCIALGGVAPSTVWKWERGATRPQYDYMGMQAVTYIHEDMRA